MVVFQLDIRPEDPWYTRLRVRLCNWLFWIAPALHDSIADDVGESYQNTVSMMVILTAIFAVIVPIIALVMGAFVWWQIALFAAGMYLLVGAIYHWHERRW